MDESEGSAFWDGKDDGYGGSFLSEKFQSNLGFDESGIQTIYDEESGSKRIRLSPESNQQEGDEDDASSQSSPLGLTLSKTPSFLRLLQSSLSKGKQHIAGLDTKSKTKMDDFGSQQSMSEKLKASNFPAIFIKIGSWQRLTRHEGDLTAKLYYAKRKLVWEVLDGALKSKIEVQWSDITAIRAATPDNEPGTLEIELNQPPLFYREINPQPRKHTLWQQTSDFTGGQAPIWRRHQVTFQPGILDKHYEKLLQCDNRLLDLSRKPFPSHESPYFDPTMFGISELSLSFNRYGSGYIPTGLEYPYQTYPTIPNPSVSVTDLPFRNDQRDSDDQFVTQLPTHWDQGPSLISSAPRTNQHFHAHHNYYQAPNAGLLSDIENHMLRDSQSHVVSSDHQSESMNPLLVTKGANAIYKANRLGIDPGFVDMSGDQGMERARNMYPSVGGGVYSQHANWMPPQECDNSMVMEQAVTNSLPAFFFPGNSTSWDFF